MSLGMPSGGARVRGMEGANAGEHGRLARVSGTNRSANRRACHAQAVFAGSKGKTLGSRKDRQGFVRRRSGQSKRSATSIRIGNGHIPQCGEPAPFRLGLERFFV